jgi:exopolysaccharide biosynthesis operon protein EpsL
MPIERRMGGLARALAAAAAVGCAAGAHADAADTLNFSAELSRQRDDNLFRLADGVSPLPLAGKSARADDIATGTFGIVLKKAYSLQEIEARYEHVSSRYAVHSFLDNEADNAAAAWRWQFTPRLKGNLSFERNQSLVGFGDFTDYGTRNLRTITRTRFDADWNIMPGGWHLRAGADRYRMRNSAIFTQDDGSRIASTDFGVRYVFPSGNRIDVLVRESDGAFVGRGLDATNQLDTGFRDRRREVRAYWARGKTILEGGFGHANRRYDHYASRDYGGTTGNFSWTWTPTGKLAIVTSWKRDFTAYTDAIASYYRQDTCSIAPVWQVGGKLRLSLRFEHGRRDYRGAVTTSPYTARADRTDSVQLAVEWAPLRSLTINGYHIDDSRESSLQGSGYGTRITGIGVRAEF